MDVRRLIRKLFSTLLDFIEIHGSTLFLFTVLLTMFGQVVARYLLKKPSPELFEITQYAFPWGVLLGAACAQRYRDHIRFNILYDKLPRKARLAIDVVFDLAIIVLFTISLPTVIRQMIWYRILRSEVLNIPWTYLVVCLPLFMVLVIIHNVTHLYSGLRELATGIPRKPMRRPWQ